jgi:hypothetical protein
MHMRSVVAMSSVMAASTAGLAMSMLLIHVMKMGRQRLRRRLLERVQRCVMRVCCTCTDFCSQIGV